MASGWHKEPRRHALAAKGISTTSKPTTTPQYLKFSNNQRCAGCGAQTKNSYCEQCQGPSRESQINTLIYQMNQSAFNNNGITDEQFAAKLMNERMSKEMLQDRVFLNLSKDKTSGTLFEEQVTDPTLPIVYVNNDFLIQRRGNKLGGLGKSVDVIKNLIKEKKKLQDVPIYDLKSGKVEEGNHRIEALKELGYNSTPVRITGGWD